MTLWAQVCLGRSQGQADGGISRGCLPALLAQGPEPGAQPGSSPGERPEDIWGWSAGSAFGRRADVSQHLSVQVVGTFFYQRIELSDQP